MITKWGLGRVLITGAQGFTGRYLSILLNQLGYEVFVLQADIRNLDVLVAEVKHINPHYLVHLAGISFTPDGKDLNIYNVHLMGSENLLKACMTIKAGLRKIILVSTCHIYGFGQEDISLSETCSAAPRTHYAISKYAMECIAETFRDDLPLLVTRPFNYTGVGQQERFLVPKLVSHFRRRSPSVVLGNIDVARDFSDVRWVAQIYRSLLESEYEGIVNLCSGRAVSIRYILEYLETKTGHHVEVLRHSDLVRKEVMMQVGNRTRLDEWVGITPYPLESTLDWMLFGN